MCGNTGNQKGVPHILKTLNVLRVLKVRDGVVVPKVFLFNVPYNLKALKVLRCFREEKHSVCSRCSRRSTILNLFVSFSSEE